jgi:hypothetical protein
MKPISLKEQNLAETFASPLTLAKVTVRKVGCSGGEAQEVAALVLVAVMCPPPSSPQLLTFRWPPPPPSSLPQLPAFGCTHQQQQASCSSFCPAPAAFAVSDFSFSSGGGGYRGCSCV